MIPLSIQRFYSVTPERQYTANHVWSLIGKPSDRGIKIKFEPGTLVYSLPQWSNITPAIFLFFRRLALKWWNQQTMNRPSGRERERTKPNCEKLTSLFKYSLFTRHFTAMRREIHSFFLGRAGLGTLHFFSRHQERVLRLNHYQPFRSHHSPPLILEQESG